MGRVEVLVVENPFVDRDFIPLHPRLSELPIQASTARTQIVVSPHWGPPREVPVAESAGGGGGGDERLLADLFTGADRDPLDRAANHIDGALSILTGIA